MRPATYALLAAKRWTRAAVATSQARSPSAANGTIQPGGRGEPPRAEVVVVAVPHVAHRRVAVAEVQGARGGAHALGHAVRAGDHEVEAAEVEGRGGGGEERQVVAVAAARRRAGAARRSCGSSRASSSGATDPRTWSSVKMGASGKRRASESSTFSPPRMPGQPVVDEGDSQGAVRVNASRGRPPRGRVAPSTFM